MEIINSLKELNNEILVWEARIHTYKARIECLKKQLNIIEGPKEMKGMSYDNTPVQTSKIYGFTEQLEGYCDIIAEIQELEHHVLLHTECLNKLYEDKKKMIQILKDTDNLDRKVVLMRDVEKKSLKQIAKELGYSYIYIREVSSRNLQRTYTQN